MILFQQLFSSHLYFHLGPNYIRPNPTAFIPKINQGKRITKELAGVMKKLKDFMSDSRNPLKIPFTSPVYKLYSDRLHAYLTQSYTATLSLRDQIRALRELKIVQSIRRKLIKYKLVLRETDKSGVLHIGRASDYERKAAEYRQKTGAYEQLTSNPFNDLICSVTRSLNQLKSNQKIKESFREKMVPDRTKTELAYMYFIPKPHKVIIIITTIFTCTHIYVFLFSERYTTPTHFKYNSCSNDKNFKTFR